MDLSAASAALVPIALSALLIAVANQRGANMLPVWIALGAFLSLLIAAKIIASVWMVVAFAFAYGIYLGAFAWVMRSTTETTRARPA